MSLHGLRYLSVKQQLKIARLLHDARSGEYLQRSIVPTDHFQKSLPRLPIPKLEDTCSRYLKALTPLLRPEEHKQATSVVEEFRKNEGTILQKELLERNKGLKHTSYISDLWFDMYLRDRSPIVLNYNPFIAFNDDRREGYMKQVARATNFVVSAMKFRRSLKENVLEPDVYHLNPEVSDTTKYRKFVRILPKSISWYGSYWYKAYPLDMSQYVRLFNSTRIPRLTKDELYTDSSARHILVVHKGRFYRFDVLDDDGNLVQAETVLANLKYICDSSSSAPAPPPPIGFMTSENRDVWANSRSRLLELGNAKQLHSIDSAMFVLVLDDKNPEDFADLAKLFLHGNPANRWFDKSFSLIVDGSGRSAINFEHAWGDGVAVLRFFNDVFSDTTARPSIRPDSEPSNVDSNELVSEIEFRLDGGLRDDIEKAKSNYEAATSKLDITYLKYTDLNKELIKSKHLSPDSFMQLAYQMAYDKLKRGTVTTYESCSTAAFKHGRTEAIRPATNETKTTCRLFEDDGVNNLQLYRSMQDCSKVHFQLTKNAALGQGFDRHMMALRKLAEEKGSQPGIFQDSSYKLINHNILSTSSLVTDALLFGGFAPVVPDGFGIGYSVTDDYLGCVTSAYRPANKASEFGEVLLHCIQKMHQVLKQVN